MHSGIVIAQRFLLKDLAGQGGMGEVWRALDQETGQDVAVKLLSALQRDRRERFLFEAKLLSELHHPGIVRYIAHGEVLPETGPVESTLYLAMEWLEGEDLAQRLSREGLTVSETLSLLSLVAEVLSFAHQRNIIHRDVKPQNIFLLRGELGAIKLLDFGIAHAQDSHLTRTGAILGTPGYMSPEQVRGQRDVDIRADIFSLGCIFFECLTGQPPFLGDDYMAVFGKILFQDPPRIATLRPELPFEIDALVHRMLSKDPGARPANTQELLSVLRLLQGEGRTQILKSPVALTASERRLVSAVFLSPGEGPLEALYPLVAGVGGQLESLPGGARLCLLEGGAATDRAQRAARLALAIQERQPSRWIAVATGRAELARTPSGEVIERGLSLLRQAALSQTTHIRIDTLTAGLLGARFEVVAEEDWLSLLQERKREDLRRRGEAAFVGREGELAMLRALLDECVATPAARAVLLTAPAGVGKTRLRQELVRPILEQGQVEVWLGWGDPTRAGAPFSLLSQAVRRACSIEEDEPAQARQQKLRARLSRHWPELLSGDWGEGTRILEFLSELIDAPLTESAKKAALSVQLRAARRDPFLMGDQLRRAWEDFVIAECRVQPVFLVLEDLHWGDLPSVQLIDSALRRVESLPFFVLALARPEVHQSFPNLWAGREVRELGLAPLSRRASERLLRQLTEERLSQSQISALLQKAGGNAFYLEELSRAALSGEERALPETVLAMAQARLETLSSMERQVLRAASLFGQVFSRSGAAALLPEEARASLDEALASLMSKDVLIRRGAGPSAEYIFRHSLYREASLVALTEEDLALGHRLAGEFLARRPGAEAVVLAEHFARGRCPERAVECYAEAAKEALLGNDLVATLERASAGLALSTPGPTRGALLALLVEAHRLRGEHREVVRYGAEALSALPRGSKRWYSVLGQTAMASARQGDRQQVLLLVGLLLEALQKPIEDEEAHAASLIALSRLLFQMINLGEHDLATTLLTALSQATAPWECKDPHVLAQLYQAYALPELFVGNPEQGVSLISSAVVYFERADDLRNACTERLDVALGFLRLGAYEEAERALLQALEGASWMGLHRVTAVAKSMLGLVLSCLGRVEEAYQSETEALGLLASQKDQLIEGISRAHLSGILLEKGALEEAEEEAQSARALLSSYPAVCCYGVARLSQVKLAKGQPEEALARAKEAIQKIAPFHWGGHGAPLARLLYAEALYALGEKGAARAAIQEAKRIVNEQAAVITSHRLQKSFLLRVPEHHRILALDTAWRLP